MIDKKKCGYNLMSCMARELEVELDTVELLKKEGIEIGEQIFKNQKQKFWSERLKIKVDIQCEKCHQIAKEKKCPELQKIFEYLKAISSDVNIKLIVDPVPSKKNGVIFYFNNFRNSSIGRVFTMSFFVAQPLRAWAIPNSE